MPDVRTPCPTAKQLSDYGLGKLSAPDLSVIQEHLTSCPRCRQRITEQPPVSVAGQLRAAAPQPSNTVLPRRTSGTETTLDEVPPELAGSSKFEVLSKLGEGGMGAVYKARHTFLNELVAIKVMNATSLANPDARSRFLREMQAVGQLKHKNIVRALDAEQIGELLVLVMEYVEGVTLDRLVEQKGRLPVGYCCGCIVQAAQGLQFAHEKSMVHRDIKPGNLIVATKERSVKLLDFGLARGTREQQAKGNHTQVGVPMGTPAFMAPEQVTDASTVDIRADVYSLGCTLYYLLAGQSPFQRDSAMTTMMAQVAEETRPLIEVRAEVPAELWTVVAKMLAKKPEHRYQTPKEVEQALRPFVTGGAKSEPAIGGKAKAGLVDAATLLPGAPRSLNPSPPPPPPAASTGETLQFNAVPTYTSRRQSQEKRKIPAWVVYSAGIAACLLTTALLAWLVLTVTTDKGKVIIEIDQPGAVVSVDGRTINILVKGDKTPIEIKVGEGTHTLEVKKDGFETKTEAFTYRKGKDTVLKVRLEKLGTVVVEIDQRGAEVTLDGEKITTFIAGEMKPIDLRVTRGKHKLVVKKDGFREETREFNVPEVKRIQVTMETATPVAKGGDDQPRVPPKETPPVKPVTEEKPRITEVPSAPERFTPLFNGKNLSGWVIDGGNKNQWSVQGNTIVSSSPHFSKRNYLLTNKEYSDFVLRFDFKVEERSHGGVAIRAIEGEKLPLGKVAIFDHPIIKLTNPAMNDREPTGTAHWLMNGTAYVRPDEILVLPTRTWHSMEVMVQGEKCTATVGGKQLLNLALDPDTRNHGGIVPALARRKGKVGFQINTGTVRYRKVEIKELAPTPPGESTTAAPKAADGFESLFNGKDLAGWTALNGQPAKWAVRDGIVEVSPGKRDIMTKKKFGPDFQLHVEFWLPLMPAAKGQARANSGVFLQGRYEVQILDSFMNDTHAAGSIGSLYGLIDPDKEALQKAIRPPEQWQTYDITFHAPTVNAVGKVTEDGRITVVLNGVTVIDDGKFNKVCGGALDNKIGAPGPVRLQDHGAAVRFRKIEIKELIRPNAR